jgi:metallo-beta-lactamase class B
MPLIQRLLVLCLAIAPVLLGGQQYSAAECPSCAEWNRPHAPVRIHGTTYYVGTDGLSALLLTSPQGHILVDAGLPESAAPIMTNIRALGFRVEDVKLIVNSHAHYDHAGGIAAIAKASGARIAATAASAAVIRSGKAGRDDPQFGVALQYPGASNVDVIADGDTLRVGPLAIVAHLTAGHTPGGTSWSWRSCEGGRCVQVVYADSQTPISDDSFRYSGDPRYPKAAADYAAGFARLEALRCDVLITPHPSASNLWARLSARGGGGTPSLIDGEACRGYVANARQLLAKRLASEQGQK